MPPPQAASISTASRGRYLINRISVFFLRVERWVVESATAFVDASGRAELDDELVEDAVDEEFAALGAELLGELDILIDGDALGDGGELGEFGHCHVEEQHVHAGHALILPALEVAAYHGLHLFGVAQRVEEQQARELEGLHVFLHAVVVHDGDEGGLVEVLVQRLQHHEVVLGNLVEVVLPEQTLREEVVAQGFVVHKELEELERKLVVFGKGFLR